MDASGGGAMMRARALRWLLGVTLLASIWATFQESPDQVAHKFPAAASRSASSGGSAPASQMLPIWPQVPKSLDDTPWPKLTEPSLLAWQTPTPAPPKPVVLSKPMVLPPQPVPVNPLPVSPRFPFKLIGQLEDQGLRTALLEDGTGTHSAITGKVINGQWKVISVSADGMEVIWIPSGKVLKIGY